MKDTYDYRARTNGEIEIVRDGSLAKLLREEEAQHFLEQVKHGDEQDVMRRFVAAQPKASRAPASDTHPAQENPLGGPVPHGDGEVREKDGQVNPEE